MKWHKYKGQKLEAPMVVQTDDGFAAVGLGTIESLEGKWSVEIDEEGDDFRYGPDKDGYCYSWDGDKILEITHVLILEVPD